MSLRLKKPRGSRRRRLLVLAAAFVLLFMCIPSATFSGDASTLLAARAAEAYDQGHYEEAAQLYERLTVSGDDGGETRYDLGNCYLKAGDLGRAILEYRRALKFSPGLDLAERNLAVARRLLPARVAPWQPSPWEAFIASVPLGLLQGLLLGCSLLGNAALAFVLLGPAGRGRRAASGFLVGAFACALLLAGTLAYALTILPSHRPAVILQPAPVYASPEGKGAPLVTLPPGSEVILAARAGDRALVIWGEGRGWTAAPDVETP